MKYTLVPRLLQRRTSRLPLHPLHWIPVLGLLVVRPVATWSYLPPSFTPPTVKSRPHTFSSNNSIMVRTTRSSKPSSTTVLAADPASSINEAGENVSSNTSTAASRKRKGAVDDDSPANKGKKKSPLPETRSPKGERGKKMEASSDTEPPSGDVKKKQNKSPSPKKKKAAPSDHQRITDRDPLPKLWDSSKAPESYTFRIASWNVAGLRALVKKNPTALSDLCKEHNLDMLCLQETKLQESHLDDPKLKLRDQVEGYDEYWSCSTAKKGYSGTAVFVKQRGTKQKSGKKQTDISNFFGKQSKVKGDIPAEKVMLDELPSDNISVDPELLTPTNTYFGIGKPIDNEGRTITLEYPFATITNVYVPNSGQILERLDYRTKEWDKDFLAFNQQKEKERGLPVIWLGDLNIAHRAYDVWNDGAKHLAKQAGVTEQERISFQEQLDAGYIDAFRKLHAEAKGHYSYWSMRAGNREPNKGLRLDYFICSPSFFSEDSQAVVRDSYMVPSCMGSDHAPVVLEIEIKPTK